MSVPTTTNARDTLLMSPESRERNLGTLTERELLCLVALSGVVMWGTAFALQRYHGLVVHYGDDTAYLAVANAILHWDFRQIDIQHFMGYPYFIAAACLLFRIPPAIALWLIATLSSIASAWIVCRLFGSVPAAYFALTNFSWLQASFIGGSEPLAMALGMGSLLAFRRDRTFWASLLAALAVTVRPLMIFLLVGIGLVLLYRKKFGAFFAALVTGLVVGILYMLPLAHYFGDPLLTVHSYTTRDYGGGGVKGPHGHLFGWPLHGIIAGTIAYPAPWSNLLLSFLWIALVLLGIAMMFSARFREYAKMHANETIFCALYLLAVFCYDYLIWARSNFIRFSIPALPFVFYALLPLLPKNRCIFWALCVMSSVLAMFSALGIRSVLGHLFG